MDLRGQEHQLITGSYFLGFIHDDEKAISVLNQLYEHLHAEGSMIIKEPVFDQDSKVKKPICNFGYYTRSIRKINLLLNKSKFNTITEQKLQLTSQEYEQEHYWFIKK